MNFFVQKVTRGNAVQIFSNFPAKRLSIYREDFFFTPFSTIQVFLLLINLY